MEETIKTLTTNIIYKIQVGRLRNEYQNEMDRIEAIVRNSLKEFLLNLV